MNLIFLGNCGAGKYPLLKALNVALANKASGSGTTEDGGSCDSRVFSDSGAFSSPSTARDTEKMAIILLVLVFILL